MVEEIGRQKQGRYRQGQKHARFVQSGSSTPHGPVATDKQDRTDGIEAGVQRRQKTRRNCRVSGVMAVPPGGRQWPHGCGGPHRSVGPGRPSAGHRSSREYGLADPPPPAWYCESPHCRACFSKPSVRCTPRWKLSRISRWSSPSGPVRNSQALRIGAEVGGIFLQFVGLIVFRIDREGDQADVGFHARTRPGAEPWCRSPMGRDRYSG